MYSRIPSTQLGPVPATASVGTKALTTRVAVVDDSPEDLLWVSRILDRKGDLFHVDTYVDPQQALSDVEAAPPDVILVDQRLGVSTGLDFFERIRKLHPFLPVILLTGQGSETLAARAIGAGMSAYLCKTGLSDDMLTAEISRAVELQAILRRKSEQDQWLQHFVRTLVHDIRAPFRHILSYAEFLEEDLASGHIELVTEHVGAIRRSVKRTDDLLRELKAYATGSDNHNAWKPVNLGEAAEQARDMIPAEARLNATIEIGPTPDILGHDAQIVQLLHNLLTNGLKYNRSASLRLSVFAAPCPDPVRLTIRDNGIGIAPESRKVVFEPLKRLNSQDEFQGSGFGLAICERIVTNHKGRIWIEEAPGGGCDFCLEFPGIDKPSGRDRIRD